MISIPADVLSAEERFKGHYRSNDAFDRAMILLDDIIQIFDLTKFNIGIVTRVVNFDICGVDTSTTKIQEVLHIPGAKSSQI